MENLQEKAFNIRKSILEMIYKAASGHPGRSLIMCGYFNSIIFFGNECRCEQSQR